MEAPGTCGRMRLPPSGHDTVGDHSDPGEEARPCLPEPLSALTACVAARGTGRRKRESELMLEFRLAGPDADAVVGSVGPPPNAASVRPHRKLGGAGRSWEKGDKGAERPKTDKKGTEDEEDASVAFWGVTRQSEWVEAKPGVQLSLISCASMDPGSSGLWFWCAAWREWTPLSDLSGSTPSAPSDKWQPAQMKIELHPIALLWNRCSMPLQLELQRAGGRGRAPNAASVFGQRAHEQRNGRARLSSEDTEVPHRGERRGEPRGHSGDDESGVDGAGAGAGRSAYRLEGRGVMGGSSSSSSPSSSIQAGGRVAVCQQPFVDYQLSVIPGDVGAGGRSSPPSPQSTEGGAVTPFAVPVPSELLSCRCDDQWLPLDTRALAENVLSPLVVVAARSYDAHWPSLSLRVHAGLTLRNHLHVPLRVRTGFSLPLQPSSSPPSPLAAHGRGHGRGSRGFGGERPRQVEADDAQEGVGEDDDGPELPLLRYGGSFSSRSVGDGSARDAPPSVVTQALCVPARSLTSVWHVHDSRGESVPFLRPVVSLDLALDEGRGRADASPSVHDESSDTPAAPSPEVGSADVGSGRGHARGRGAAQSARVVMDLQRDLSELVLVPWRAPEVAAGSLGGGGAPVVLPVVVTVSRVSVTGGVDLIHLEVHPRVVLHNATKLPVRVSLLALHAGQGEDAADSVEDGGPPLCSVCLAPEGQGSCVDLVALPEGGSVAASPDPAELGSSGPRVVDPACGDMQGGEEASSGVGSGLRWLMKSASYTNASSRHDKPQGFGADVQVAFEPAGADGDAVGAEGREWNSRFGGAISGPSGVDGGAIVSLLEPSGGAALRCGPAWLTMEADGGRRAARVCLAMESSDSTPTRHVALYQDPQPDLVIWNESAAAVTVMLDSGASLEVMPGHSAEYSWAGQKKSPPSGGPAGRPLRPYSASAAPLDRHASEAVASPLSSGRSSRPASPSSRARASGMRRRWNRLSASAGSEVGSDGVGKGRASSKLFGSPDATLRHWFKCKPGVKEDALVQWSNPLWLAQGVQVMTFDVPAAVGDGDEGHGDEGHGVPEASPWRGGRRDDPALPLSGASLRHVQVHVMERAGGFVMSLTEGAFQYLPLPLVVSPREDEAAAITGHR